MSTCCLTIVLVHAGNECKLVDPKSKGGSCTSHKECLYPLVCYHTICSERKPDNGTCSTNSDCASDVTKMKCANGQCILEAANGESCVNRNCVDTSDCLNDVCSSKDCSDDDECGLNYYCSESKCIKATPGGSCSKDSMCLVNEVCSGDKCVEKYSGEIGTVCHSPEQCNVYDGYVCDKNANICKRNSYLDKECYVDSECGGGSCACTGSNKVCVGYDGAMSISACKDMSETVAKCLIDNQCTRTLPETCPKCYNDWLCYQFRCNSNYASDPTYSSLDAKCPKITTTKPKVQTPVNHNNPATHEENENSNSNTGFTLTYSSFLILILSLLTFVLV
ncbi:hypothetical protein PPL_02670 [Heterostelium album PN500]|uniref:Uncharacterized protein n=1 Tax=Heterostelium pallidum (strain ATCC 26659 / Pp 5 / PN500) TaxID=670386 RepID=D3B2Q6_HETP5|nr:hypothetical protein PPL_02670 [Heterostelium album PN500]EFA83604.1 hypothetical protein PPL_02670 [Heterostelium album PN500]|eukprot:XP_020435721.1 hypothetical protein PPL_02670 [Heterostelium album PN500]